jgi:hypothetical protein
MPPTTSPLITGFLALVLATSLGCAEDDVALDDTEVRASPLLPSDPGDDPPPQPPQDHNQPQQTKVCKSSCETCVALHKPAYECLAFDKSFDDSPDPLADFACIVCDNDGPVSAANTCSTQAKIQGVFFTDMEAERVQCGRSHNQPDLPVAAQH